MNPTRREFVKGGLASLGFLALPGGLFAEGWWYMNFGTGIFPDKNVRAKFLDEHSGEPWMAPGAKARLFKCVFAEGMNLGYGHEPNHGITMLEIPGDQLPAGKKLTIGVRPLSSLGTKGKTISTTFRV